MIDLNNFSFPNKLSFITICERNSFLISIDPNDNNFNFQIFPDEYLSSDKIRESSIQPFNASSGFLRNQMPFYVKLISGFYDRGFFELLSILSTMEANLLITKCISSLAKCGLRIYGMFSGNKCKLSKNCATDEYSFTIERKSSYIRCLSWHPHSPYLAIVTRNDCIKIKKYYSQEETKLLHHIQQFNIYDVAWRPYYYNLAVGCEAGVVVWDLDSKKSLSNSGFKLLKYKGHSPVTSISWEPTGSVLVSSSPNSADIVIWNVELETFTALKRLMVSGIPLVSWSPNGCRLFSSTLTNKFNIWKAKNMNNDAWLKVKCQACCWSPNGQILLIVSSEVPIIYSVTFKDSCQSVEQDGYVSPSINLAPVEFSAEDSKIHVGGLVHSMQWDTHGERLAVMFKKCDFPGYIALFRTKYLPNFSAVPIGLITGFVEEYAVHMKFMPSFDSGSLLSIAWSSGRLSHVPLYYTPSTNKPFN